MTIASKTVLLQMRFVRMGGAFCSIAAKSTIDTSDYSNKGDAFYGVGNTITPPVYTFTSAPVRQGAPLKITALRQIRYGGVNKGAPIFSQLPTPTYTPYTANPVRQGNAFKWVTAKTTINASGFDYYNQGQSFWVKYTAPSPPGGFDASRMFIIF